MTAVGWPPIKVLQQQVRQPGTTAVIGIYDLKTSRNVTRWPPVILSQVMQPTGLVATPSSGTTPIDITLTGSVNQGDAVGLSIGIGGGNWLAVTYIPTAGDSLGSVASGLVAAISSDPEMVGIVGASAAGGVVTLTSLQSPSKMLNVICATGNIGTQLSEVGRRCRDLQIVVWTGTELSRQAVTDPIESLLAVLESSGSWLSLADGTQGRLHYQNDYYIETGSPQDLYRRDFHVEVEYGVTAVDALYDVLAVGVNVNVNSAG